MAFLIILDIVILNAINNSNNNYISPFGQVKQQKVEFPDLKINKFRKRIRNIKYRFVR